MALKETLTRLNKSVSPHGGVSQAELKQEWLNALLDLYNRIEDYLSEYVNEGSIVLRRTTKPIKEDALGLYSVPKLIILAGPAQVEVTPVGRIVAGAVGRVDMHRQGRSQTILLLRFVSTGPEGTSMWRLHVPPPSMSTSVGVMVSLRPSEVFDLEQNSFEYALDILLS